MEHLTQKKLDVVCNRLWHAHGSLRGLGGLFTQGNRDTVFEDGELYGVGLLIKKIGEELEILEDILRCGHDSGADERNGSTSEKNN
ncbi:MAG: hypothetical protein H6626_05385 [Pseudobdellovibrionaceae bacterium]|nr:MAG: hypothetical protein H6626_05385 [Pseudobdellovibrionaceae bacterium]